MNVLFITYSRIGDAVLSTGVLAELIRLNPKLNITIACGPVASSLFQAVPNLVRVIAMPKRKASLHWLELWRQCVSVRWDILVDLRNSAASRFLRAKRKYIGGRADPSCHRVEHLGAIMDMSPAPAPRLWLKEHHLSRAREMLPADGPILALGPVANWSGKQWDAKRFAELANRLTSRSGIMRGASVVILGGPEERAQAEFVSAMIPAAQRIDLVGKVDLLTACAVLHQCSLFVGNDSGLMHIAAASGVATLGLFGPSREKHYAPWGSRSSVVRTKLGYDELVGRPDYDHRTTDSLMGSLAVDDVEEAVIELWRRLGERGT